MEETISTIYFNGQFWKALIEKSNSYGPRQLAEYTFGSEPATGELLDFYLNKYHLLIFVQSEREVRIRKHRKDNTDRISKSHDEYKEKQKLMLDIRKSERNLLMKIEADEKYQLMRLKKKRKKRGH
ncbi:MAG: DUF2992 family protein [Spirochaetales bacterium]|nr:DUF2992 family protein [Spirochaetales bacterium]